MIRFTVHDWVSFDVRGFVGTGFDTEPYQGALDKFHFVRKFSLCQTSSFF